MLDISMWSVRGSFTIGTERIHLQQNDA